MSGPSWARCKDIIVKLLLKVRTLREEARACRARRLPGGRWRGGGRAPSLRPGQSLTPLPLRLQVQPNDEADSYDELQRLSPETLLSKAESMLHGESRGAAHRATAKGRSCVVRPV